MPSIYEVPVSEASWVAPGIRPKGPPSMRKRCKTSSTIHDIQQSTTASRTQDAGSSVRTPRQPQSLISKFTAFWGGQSALRTAINALIIAFILHLLVLPEIIYQLQGLCHLPAIKTTYPESCAQLKQQIHPFYPPVNPVAPPEESSIKSSQQSLESIFETTLGTLSPLTNTLKESESMLRDLQDKLQLTFPAVRNALDLEFQGSEQALHAAAWEFDSLRADLRSAVDSLLSSPPTQEATGGSASVARDTRLAAQNRRRAEYLDRLRAQIRTKADSLGTRFSTLDDHLEAVDGIVAREERKGSLLTAVSGGETPGPRTGAGGGDGTGLHAVLNSLSGYASFGSRLWSRSTDDSSAPGTDSDDSEGERKSITQPPVTTLALLRLAATHHRPVADSVADLSRQLGDAQRARLGPTW
ncbi:hypothetical protein N7454_007399 [Penicillium verhagenii]|nr:hypothetical protein N7454_007399 [Penicillium verhagenii]